MASNVTSPSLPWSGPVEAPLVPGLLIRVTGRVLSQANCFAVNLQTSPERTTIGLHVSPIFSHPQRIVRNSLSDGQWGPEESHGTDKMPVQRDGPFDLMLKLDEEKWNVALNNAHVASFNHRVSYRSLEFMSIDGDCTVDRIDFFPPPPDHCSSPIEDRRGVSAAPPMVTAPPPYGNQPPPGAPYPQGALGFGAMPPLPSHDYSTSNVPYPGSEGSPYPGGGGAPYPGGPPPMGGGYPPVSGGYPPVSGGYPPVSGGYPPVSGGYHPPGGGGYPPVSGGYQPPVSGGYQPPVSGGYQPPGGAGYPPVSGGYQPPVSGGYPGAGPSGAAPLYPGQGHYPGAGAPGYGPGQQQKQGGIMGKLSGLAAGASAIPIAGALFGGHKGGMMKQKKQKKGMMSHIPGGAGGLAAGALGAYAISRVAKNPFKMKKHKMGKFGGWSSSSSSSEEE